MTFTDNAMQLCGQCALLLGWRPDEFWKSTPAELACIFQSVIARDETPPDAVDIKKMMELFPDG